MSNCHIWFEVRASKRTAAGARAKPSGVSTPCSSSSSMHRLVESRLRLRFKVRTFRAATISQ